MFNDPVLKKLAKKYQAPEFIDRSEYLFDELVESVISQQLSVKAADTIYERFKALFPKSTPTPKKILKMDDKIIRTAGISFSKISYIKNIADAFVTNKIDINKIKTLPDEDVIIELTKLKGVGRWTAEMTLIFTLKRPDIFSIGDAGLRRAVKNLYGVTEEKEIAELSEKWKPHRSLACWYLWKSLENT